MIQVPNFHENSLHNFIRAYLSNYFNALVEGVEKNLEVNLKAGLLEEHIEVVGKDKEVTNL